MSRRAGPSRLAGAWASRLRAAAAVMVAAVLAAACSKPSSVIAELAKADGPVEKQQQEQAWLAAPIGTEYALGDAARTADGRAELVVVGNAKILMQPRTVLRFGGSRTTARMVVELGAIDLSGTGNYGLDIGDVQLSNNGTLRITSRGNGQTSYELTIGDAQVSTAGGDKIALEIGKAIEISPVAVTPVDAGVPDAAVVAVADAAPEPAPASEATVEVTGRSAQLLAPGETGWKPLPAGSAPLARGAKVRVVGPGTTARLTARGTVLELGGGGRAAVGDDYALALEAGGGHATAATTAGLALPGGGLTLSGSERVLADARIDVGRAGSKVTIQRGGGRLTGAAASALAMSRGESATLSATGKITPLEAIPGYFDFSVAVGESFTVHDPRPPASLRFDFRGKCPDGGIVELDRDPRFRTAKVSAGTDAVNHLVRAGAWSYRLRCTRGSGEGGAVAAGRVAVVADGGTRTLPRLPPVNPFDTDGRPWSYSYQSVIPDLNVRFIGPAARYRLHLARGGKELTFDSTSPTMRLPGSALTEGTYTYWYDRDGVKQDKIATLTIDFDQTAPQVYIESPANARPWAAEIPVRGAVLPGWTAAIDTVTIPIDRSRRFIANVQPPSTGNALAIRLSHPARGVHYYLRRQK